MTTTCNDITSPKSAVSLSQRGKEDDKPTLTDQTPLDCSMISKNHTQILQSTSVTGPPTDITSLANVTDETPPKTVIAPKNQAQSLESPVVIGPLTDITEENVLEKVNQRIRFNLSQPERPSVYTKRLIISMDPARFEAFKAVSQQTGHSMARLMRGAIDTLVEMYQENHEVPEHKQTRGIQVTSIPIGEITKRSEVSKQ